MKTVEFIESLRRRGVNLWSEGRRLLYRAPEGVLTNELRMELEHRKPDIMALLSDTSTPAQEFGPAPLPVTAGSINLSPLSFSQERVWFLSQLEPSSPSYNVHKAIEIEGPLNLGALEAAFQEILKRHQVFRSICTVVEGKPYQLLDAEISWKMHLLDLGSFAKEEQQEEVLKLAGEEARKPFQLDRGPLLRVNLLRLNSESHVLLLTTHHFATDGWSLRFLLMQELTALYEAFLNGAVSPLPMPPLQFSQYARQQREQPHGERLETWLSYWKKQLLGVSTILELPRDLPRPAVKTYQGATKRFRLPGSLSQALRELSRKEGVTLFMLLLAAFQILLHRFTGQQDFLVGTATSFRNRTELESLIGPFTNVLALRARFSGDRSFREFLGRVRETVAGAFANQELPFERLLEELQPERDLSRNPLFQVMFLLHHFTSDQNLKLAGLTLRSLPIEMGTSRFDLSLEMEDGEDELAGSLEYSTELFKGSTIERISQCYRALLESILSNPDERISRLRVLTEAERRRVLLELGGTESRCDARCIHELFEEQTERSPMAIAVVFEEERLTYSSLNGRANQVAHHLRGLGVGPETLVGLCLDRSPEMIAGMLGILKAGGAYLPLDPTWPEARLSFMLKDTGTRIILTRDQFISCLPNNQARIVSLDRDAEAIGNQSKDTPISEIHPDCLAYVIYTSGSTGKPKGVAITNRSVCALLYWAKDTFEAKDRTGVLASTSVCFDLSVFELFLPLCTGGRVILARDALHLRDLTAAMDVTLVNIVPSVAAELLRTCTVPDSVRVFNLAGEPLPISVAQLAYRQPGVQKVFNLYGPSEDTVYSTALLVRKEDTVDPSIGRPISNTRVYILDEHFEPVPQGVAGELFIGGAGVARGYFNRPALTAERFLPDPFSPSAGGRLYRTGDLARHLPNGSIEFLGRVDDQIKLRGFRIEPGEVRAVLEGHPSVERAVVLAEGGLLLSFVTPRSGPCGADLRDFLRKTLPDYMVPSRITRVEAFPLTPSGKVDKAALLALDAPGQDHPADSLSPKGDLELTIALIWKEVLRLDTVGSRQSFFDLGGHSLLLAQVHSRLQRCLGRTIPLLDLFRYPTISSLARYLEQDHPHHPFQALSRAKLQVEATRRQALLARKRRKKKNG
jgi:amino acid adenylation domain-containing protein